ncbi:PAAR domain-containing protein [Yoonia sp. R2331]|uniref:PAAR domain-containing protein n=1 Tax=Yoonia sp. R2331 TaxID=3237238 RepID=UPI0034E5BF7C
MPAASRKGDICVGHGCFPPTPSIAGSPNVSIDGIPALRKGDAVAPHGCSNCPPHGRSVSAGSPTVFVNGRPLARIGDGVDCGGSVSAGSGTVTADVQPAPTFSPLRLARGAPCVRECMRDANRKGQAFVTSSG